MRQLRQVPFRTSEVDALSPGGPLRFSIGDSGEVRARRKHVIGDETGEAIDYSKPMSGWLVATTLPSVDARKVRLASGHGARRRKLGPIVSASNRH